MSVNTIVDWPAVDARIHEALGLKPVPVNQFGDRPRVGEAAYWGAPAYHLHYNRAIEALDMMIARFKQLSYRITGGSQDGGMHHAELWDGTTWWQSGREDGLAKAICHALLKFIESDAFTAPRS